MTCEEGQNLVVKGSVHQVDRAKLSVSLADSSSKAHEAEADERGSRGGRD